MMMYQVWLTPHQKRLPSPTGYKYCDNAGQLALSLSFIHPFGKVPTAAAKDYNHNEHVSNLCHRTSFLHRLRYPFALPSIQDNQSLRHPSFSTWLADPPLELECQ